MSGEMNRRGFIRGAGFIFAPEAKSVLAIDGLEHMNPGFVDRLIHGESEQRHSRSELCAVVARKEGH